MKLIIWLWNPWEKYEITRHNLGFLFLDSFAQKNNFWEFKYESKFKAEIATWTYKGEKTLLVKPQTFMNLSGEAVHKITQFYKIEKENWIVVYDDMSMDFWKTRFRDKWRPGGHNGIKDIVRFYGEEFKRVKVGIWFNQLYGVSDWVLSKFTADELIDLENETFAHIKEIINAKL